MKEKTPKFYTKEGTNNPDELFEVGVITEEERDKMKEQKDCVWIWDTEEDRLQAIEMEKRVKEKQKEEIINLLENCKGKNNCLIKETDIGEYEKFVNIRWIKDKLEERK